MLNELYRPPLALLTDLYQLTMAYGYWKLGRDNQQAVFHLFFRKPPFNGGYAIAAGLAQAIEYMRGYRFDDSDIEYLASLTGNDDQALFDDGFLDYLSKMKLQVDVDAMPEGTLAFGSQPMLRIRGPILQCQLLETPLLNIVNFQTLIATKASRIAASAAGEPILEFGLRRSQGIDGSLSASRAAHIGGCAATSNVLAGKMYGIPVKGTHAHSWVMSFDTEAESFANYADAMPNNCVFLVDTYDTIQGVREAVKAGIQLRNRGHEMVGIRLDSGDLAYLSIEARRILDEGGFENAAIVASNDLDEHIIESLKIQGAKITVWGVGTKLATAFDQPALGGVYKLGALQDDQGNWQPKVKLSEQLIKTSIPGTLQVRRFEKNGQMIGDMIYDEDMGVNPSLEIVDTKDPTRRKRFPSEATASDLLVPVMRDGVPTGPPEEISTIRERAINQLTRLHPTSRRLLNPHEYPVGLDVDLNRVRNEMIDAARKTS
ncbi:Nicotinate phosphoribosyltransferase pncB2 [Rubripirellula obstinata]|uniref:Nicotinate phosphoribosyltransferase n=1 Tax=Rubripirellula obstinata TaxID=406547 RepID=A0A5B1CM27_9BACT|nr:nicotinate phosphoribosyltransferase [Rubripirellula obstinata]KAA1262128.1 Nicotinate phosphoribosyltransferase pncB2 [Rubripirellula obstinata]